MAKRARAPKPDDFEDFPDVALQHPTGSTLASQPECLWCEGLIWLIWAGSVVVVLNAKKVAHLACFETNARETLVGEVRGRIGKRGR